MPGNPGLIDIAAGGEKLGHGGGEKIQPHDACAVVPGLADEVLQVLEDLDELDPRVSALGDIEALLESDAEEVPGDEHDNGNGIGNRDRVSSEGDTLEPM